MSGASNDPNTPLRPPASPRPSFSNLSRRSSYYNSSSEASETQSNSSEAQSPTRGRTMARIPPQRTNPRQATIIHRDRQRTREWESESTQHRLMSRDLTAEPICMFDSLKEPLPIGVERYRSSLSEELYKATTWNFSTDQLRFWNHRDTFAVFDLRRSQIHLIGLPDEVFVCLLCYIDFETYLAIRLSCRFWSEAITRARPIVVRPVCRLPPEILQRIYFHLDPIDFDSARHTCRAWMITSLEEKLLTIMLARGGWLQAANFDVKLQSLSDGPKTADRVNQEWLLSKLLATECSLRPDWKGNGLPEDSPPSSLPKGLASRNLSLTAITDFFDLSNGYSPGGDCKHGSALQFTVSVCKNFVLVAEDCLVYIYLVSSASPSSNGTHPHLSHLTIVMCPHRVLAVSIDTSSNRLAIAALLEGRVGFICDVLDNTSGSRNHSAPRALSTAIRSSRRMASNSQHSSDQVVEEGTDPRESASFDIADDQATTRTIAEALLPEIHGARSIRQLWAMDDPFLSPIEASVYSQDYEIPHDYTLPAKGHRSVYRNLCSSEDPPRSVAICPQRRCVAFGCAAGIELHWMDALTGQDLSRWFPLTAPSDYLCFFPARPGIDDAKKLRLISSAAHPKEVSALQRKFFPRDSNDATGYQSMTWDEEFQGIELNGSAWRGSGWCDHYHAVPISDSQSILFTDPQDGTLCLGSDAPPGAPPSKLFKRFCFTGPVDGDGNSIVPGIYASSRELNWGVRVVVGYAEALWLFAVPPDVFFAIDHHGGEREQEPHEAKDSEPTQIEGVEIGKVHGLIDVAVDASGGDIIVWAFTASGMAYTWQIGGGRGPWQEWMVERDGNIMPLQDAGGDSFLHGVPSPAVHFDGNDLVPSPRQGFLCDRIIDKENDQRMQNADEDEGYGSEFEAAGGTFAIHAPPLWGRWSEDDADWVPDYLAEHGSDIGDDGIGIDVLEMSRMDVEVTCG